MFSKNVFCGATSPRLPPGILGLESGGQDPRRGRGAAGRGGGEDGAERRGGAAAGPPGGVCSPTRMNSSGEDGQAAHGSSASPAAAARTVAAPHTGRGSCGLRGAQCACAAPAVTVPPVLMLQPPPGLLPRAPWSRARGLSMSPCPAPRAGGAGRAGSGPAVQSLVARPRTRRGALAPRPAGAAPPAAGSRPPPAEPNFCGAVRPASAPLAVPRAVGWEREWGTQAGCRGGQRAVGGITAQLLPPGPSPERVCGRRWPRSAEAGRRAATGRAAGRGAAPGRRAPAPSPSGLRLRAPRGALGARPARAPRSPPRLALALRGGSASPAADGARAATASRPPGEVAETTALSARSRGRGRGGGGGSRAAPGAKLSRAGCPRAPL